LLIYRIAILILTEISYQIGIQKYYLLGTSGESSFGARGKDWGSLPYGEKNFGPPIAIHSSPLIAELLGSIPKLESEYF